jgi:hypothetical protein
MRPNYSTAFTVDGIQDRIGLWLCLTLTQDHRGLIRNNPTYEPHRQYSLQPSNKSGTEAARNEEIAKIYS